MSRRRALTGSAALGLGIPLLAACGSEEDGGSGEAPEAGPVIATSEVAVGSAVVVADRELVVSQPSEGEFQVFSNICTHQGCPMEKVVGDSIDCTCHGSRFSIADGSVRQGPAEESLPAVEFAVENGEIVVGP